MKRLAQDVLRTVIPTRARRVLKANVLDFLGARAADPNPNVPTYAHDGILTYGKLTHWLHDARFRAAYAAGMDSGHKIARPKGSRDDIHIEWRAHICCWAASHAAQLDGDFVECGVNTGIMSLAICHFVGFNDMAKKFYLFDTYQGIPPAQMSPSERERRAGENAIFYEECFETARANFAPFPNVVLVRGRVPETLSDVQIEKVSYLHIDMNIAYPEVAAAEFFWPKLVTGGIVVLDDYGFAGYEEQREAMDAFASRHDVRIASLLTGQGLLVKP